MTNQLNVNVKRLHPDAVIPTYATDGDAGLDLTAVSKEYDKFGNVSYLVGLAFEIPKGYAGFLFPRSSISKKDLSLTNAVGVIDSGYRGDVGMKFKPTACFMDWLEKTEYQAKHTSDFVGFPEMKNSASIDDVVLEEYEVGERIGQIIIMPVPKVTLVEVEELSDTERGTGGYGSTGK